MKTAAVTPSLLAILVGLGCAATQTKREANANISKTDAAKIALARVPSGAIKESELEKEHGKLVWSFDIATPGTSDITEVQVDAMTGQVVSVEKETPAQQEVEKQKDQSGQR